MDAHRDSIAGVSMAVLAAMLYARLASTHLRPGLARLAVLLPVLALLVAVPLSFSSTVVRGTAGFFLAWLGAFKVALLAFDRGPLDRSLPVISFLFTAALPVKLKRSHSDVTARSKLQPMLLVSCAVKVAIIAAVLHLYRFIDQLNPYMRRALYSVHIYCFLDFLLPCIAAVGGVLGMEMEPQFDKPYLAASLRDFWGRRWNLMVSAILRPAVYIPVRARLGALVGVMATFLVSGLMHEAMLYYITLRPPTGEMTAFFVLHGACAAAEAWCASRVGRWRPPRVLATPLVVGFVACTAFWMFFPPLLRGGMEEKLLEEWAAVATFFREAGRERLSVWSTQ